MKAGGTCVVVVVFGIEVKVNRIIEARQRHFSFAAWVTHPPSTKVSSFASSTASHR